MQVLTSDQKLYTLKNFHIQYSKLFTDLESTIIDGPVLLLVKSDIFDIVLDFMNIEQNVYSSDSKINVTQRERNFFTKYGIDTVIDVCSAANYLCYYLLLEVSANVVAECFKSKDMEELNSLFGNEMNENEKRNIAKDFDWIPDKNEL